MRNTMFKLGRMPSALDLLNYFVGLTTKNWTAAASVAVSAIQGRKARKAAQGSAAAQTAAQRTALDEQRRQFDISRKDLAPFREAELKSLQERQALTGLLGTEEQQAAIGRISSGPGIDFQRGRAEQALMRQASATGGLGGSRVQEALQQQAIGFAQQDLQSQLQGLRGMGAGSTVNTANLGQQFGQQFAQGMGNIGQAQAGGILGAAKAQNQMYGSIAKGIGQAYGAKL